MNEIQNLQPQCIWKNFYALTQVPRPSGHLEKIQQFLLDFGKQAGVYAVKDPAGNIHFRKPATPGMENKQGIILQAGAMQMIVGNVQMNTNVQGAGDLFKKFIGSKVTKESAIKPRYFGTGQVILEPTFKYIILEDLAKWNGSMVIEDGLFLACTDSVQMKVTARSSFSSAVAGGEGLFNTSLNGSGIVVLESYVPAEELLVFDIVNDTLKIDGSMAIAWSNSLEFTVERSSKTLIGSAASGEGLVNVYRGTGRVLVAPVA